MTIRAWGRSAARSRAMEARLTSRLAAKVQFRFSVGAAAFAERVAACAQAAGLDLDEFVARASLDDLYLASACAADDPDAWAECEAGHFAFIRAFARRFLSDADAADLADGVIADLWQRGKIARYCGRSSLRTWLGSVVAHAAVNVRRAKPITVSISDRTEAVLPRTVAAPERQDDERRLARLVALAIQALPAEDKLLLRLYYEQGLTLDQMEGLMAASKATLSRRLKALRERLRASVDAPGAGAAPANVRAGVRLERVEFDLAALLRPGQATKERNGNGV